MLILYNYIIFAQRKINNKPLKSKNHENHYH
nr:MAG TPA: hypothetical protein [Caudoviricetes sp.]